MAKKLFISYSHADAGMLERLHKHLAQLQREGSVEAWYDREIQAGGRLDGEISQSLLSADIFIAALSPDFIASSYCYDVELQTALQREVAGELIVVPVIFQPCDWLATPLGKFKALPQDGKAVSEFSNENVALLGVTSELRRLINAMQSTSKSASAASNVEASTQATSRYRIRRDFDQIDKRDFINRSFDDIKKFFKSSVDEINSIPEIDAEIRDQDQDSFSCTIINRGMGRAFETITVRRGSGFGDISIAYGENPRNNISNGGFTVESSEYELFLSNRFGFGHSASERMTAVDAAKALWDELLKKVGVDYA